MHANFMQALPPLRVKPQGMSQLRFNKILRLAKAGEICAVLDHNYRDVPVPDQSFEYAGHTGTSDNTVYHSRMGTMNRPLPPRPKRKCVVCEKVQEHRPADWVDA